MQREGFREIADRARHLIEREPAQSQILQDFVHLPQQIMQYGQIPERMGYSSHNFKFPESAYHPSPPSGAYHYGASSSGNYPIFRNTSPNMNFITPPPYNMFDASNNMFGTTFGMEPHINTGRQTAHVTPLPMRDWSAPTTYEPQVTNLGNDDEIDEGAPLQRGHRRRNRPLCGTGGHH